MIGLCYQAFWVQDFVKLREFMKTLMVTSAITSQVTEVSPNNPDNHI